MVGIQQPQASKRPKHKNKANTQKRKWNTHKKAHITQLRKQQCKLHTGKINNNNNNNNNSGIISKTTLASKFYAHFSGQIY
jgi:hypothetical protein